MANPVHFNRRLLLLGLAVLLAASVQAQISESDTAKFQLRLSLTGNRQTGNVELLLLRGKLDFLHWFGKSWVLKSQNNSLYQAFFSRKADGDVYSQNYFYYKPQSRFYPFAIAYISTNFRRKIDSRYFAGAGATWQVLRQPGHTIKLSVNGLHESTRFASRLFNDPAYDGNEVIALWRATIYVSGAHEVFETPLRIFYDGFWQPAFEDANNYRSQFDCGLELPIWKGLRFNALYTYTYENIVALGVRQADSILSFGLSYQFKKTGT